MVLLLLGFLLQLALAIVSHSQEVDSVDSVSTGIQTMRDMRVREETVGQLEWLVRQRHFVKTGLWTGHTLEYLENSID